MTMILQLLVAAVTATLSVDAAVVYVPPYGHYVKEINQTVDSLRKNVLSMEGNIPLLNDSRRHYAEIVYVINYLGISLTALGADYDEYYQNYVNQSASDAIHNPEKVVTQTGNLINKVHDRISEIEELIAACQNTHLCDELIDDTVKENNDQYGRQAAILIAAGRAAVKFNFKNQEFEDVSKDLTAHHYVLKSPDELKTIVMNLSELHLLLRFP